MKYLLLESGTNRIITGYVDGIHKDIPIEAIKVKEDIWEERLNNPSLNCYEHGKLSYKDFRTNKEILNDENKNKINEYKQYLKDTDWVKDYKTRHDLNLEIIPLESNKWNIINKRNEYLAYLQGL